MKEFFREKINYLFFKFVYLVSPPWDISRPQSSIVKVLKNREIQGEVLDIGCGSGENALYLASQGYNVTGIDLSKNAIKKALIKAKNLGLNVNFKVDNALYLKTNKKFDTVIDCGLFHILSENDRSKFEKNLYKIIKPNGKYIVLCFNEREKFLPLPSILFGPRRIRKKEIKNCFNDLWKINYINETLYENKLHKKGGKAWICSITRL